MRFFTLLVAVLGLLCATTVQAIPARGTPIVVHQADGTTITIVVRGDERSHWTSTIDGYQIVQQNGVYYYYEPQLSRSGGALRKASDPEARSAAETSALAGRTKGRLSRTIKSPARQMSYPLAERLSTLKTEPSKAVTIPSRSLVLLVAFEDTPFRAEHSISDFDNLLNTGSTSARQYFTENSRGIYSPTFDIKGPYTLPHPVAYYGANDDEEGLDSDPKQMVIDACTVAAAQGVNFSIYDENKDGLVDNVYILYAGLNEADGGGDDTVWPHRWNLHGKPATRFNGVLVWDYACGSELSASSVSGGGVLAGIGTFCHEFGHVLGLPDFYDTNYEEDGESVGLYHFSIMGSGCYNNNGFTPPYYTSVDRWMLGWTQLHELEVGKEKTLQPVENEPNGWYIATGNPNEFYLVEARGSNRWDKFLYGSGLLIYHIDRSKNDVFGSTAEERWRKNELNAYAAHPCARLIESGGATLPSLFPGQRESKMRSDVAKIFYPGSGNIDEFTGSSWGGINWHGNPVATELLSIKNQNGTVSFTTRASQGLALPLSVQPSQRSVVVEISPLLYNKVSEGSSFVFSTQTQGQVTQRKLLTGRPLSITVSDLSPGTLYNGTLWVISPEGHEEPLASADFITLPLSAPYAVLTGLKGRLPVGTQVHLGVMNLPARTTSVIFSINGTEIDGNSYTFTSTGQQTVRCTISYSIGDIEIIERIVMIE